MLKRVGHESRLRLGFRTLSVIIALFAGFGVIASRAQKPSPPPSRVENVRETIHGVEVVDPYRWLEDQQSPETRAWIEAQNKYARSFLDSWPGREALRQRFTELMRIDAVSIPTQRNGRYFFKKRLASQDQGALCVRKGLAGDDEALVDPNALSPDKSISANIEEVSQDGKVLAFTLRQGGEDEVTVHFLDVDSHTELPDRLPRGNYFGVSLKPDRSGCYYARQEKDGPRVYYHVMGSDPAKDLEIFGKGYGPDKIIGAGLSEDGRYLIFHVMYGSVGEKTEVYFQDLAGKAGILPIVNDLPARFFGDVGGDQLFLWTNWKAPKGRILAVDLGNPARDKWRELVPESEAVIETMGAVGGDLVVQYVQNAASRLKIFAADGRRPREVELPAIGSVAGISGRWTSKEVFYGFTSFHMPSTIYRYDVDNGQQEVWARQHVPIRSEKFQVQQVWYESKDKTRIPMFLMHQKGIKLDGARPTLLTGYGGFNISMSPYFSSMAAAWAERGGVFALPNLRGGGEFGEEWHRAGMFGNKQNVFDDFIAAAEWLIKRGYTNPSRLAISGRSNGGLLVGAALTQRPELFQAVICGYPLLDMLRYQNFLVARYWVSEYGASENPEQFKALYAYSPYHHVRPGTAYPAVLLVSGDGDTRVAPLHARKMTALLQAATGSDRPVLLRYDTQAGHSAGVSVTKEIDESTDELGFLLWQLGVTLNAPAD